MKHIGTLRIETRRLILRRFTVADAQAMYDNWASDPEVTKFLTWPTHSSVEITKMVLSDWVAGYEKPDFYQWAIEFKEIGQPIGSISVVSHNDRAELVHIGYCIGRNWWHKGIMSEALQAVMDFLFDQVGANRIESRHDPRNPHSGAVMRKCGMKYEGTLRQSDWNNQGICDASWYALTASERNAPMVFHKLVRDKIPEFIAAQGERANIRVLEEEEYARCLERKLDEEVEEYHRAQNLEELADILEVVLALSEDLGYTHEELVKAYQEKHEKRGGFDNRFFLVSKEG